MKGKLNMDEMTGNAPYIINEGDNSKDDKIALMAIEELLNKAKLKRVSRLKFEQISLMAKLYMFSDVFKENFTKKLADLILELQISTNGLGRKELVQLVQQRSDLFGEVVSKKQTSKDIFR